jgi:hypothetical protein
MAYIGYDQKAVGGMQLAEACGELQDVVDKMRNLAAWIGQIGPSNLESNTDFKVEAGQGQAFNDTFLQVNQDLVTFMTTNREKIERLARGS